MLSRKYIQSFWGHYLHHLRALSEHPCRCGIKCLVALEREAWHNEFFFGGGYTAESLKILA